MRKRTQTGRAFTLIELLVVIAIIAILAALFIPYVSLARAGRCGMNLRQISMVHALAVADNSNRYGSVRWWLEDPNRRDPGDEQNLMDFWSTFARTDQGGWICPTAPVKEHKMLDAQDCWGMPGDWNSAWQLKWRDPETGEIQERASSYGYNQAFNHQEVQNLLAQESPVLKALKFAGFDSEGDVQHPSQTPVWGDCQRNWDVRFSVTPPPETIAPVGIEYMSMGFAIARHGNRPKNVPDNEPYPANKPLPAATNLSFADGHVEEVPLERLWSLYWHRNYEPPAKRPGL